MTRKRGRDQFNKYKWAINLIVSYYRLFPLRRRKKIFAAKRRVGGLRETAWITSVSTIVNINVQNPTTIKLILKRG